MQNNQAWIAMLRRIPGELHDSLALGLTTAAEIVVQKIVKLEPEFMIIRGRLAGTQDTGRLVMIPYAELAFVAVQRELKDAEVEAMFGKGAPPPLADLAALAAGPAPEVADEPGAPVPQEPVPAEPAKKPAALSKSALVAKLRERLKDK